ncbi:hypothetical protein EDD39_7429 [Kitasatospora cineracea]|uniref:Uncharacterized protein n=1 Tax=Kitasatospora cineracea TaxID=88074 RepID=A0A8G1UAB3_9ACTN|nr:hypothetical protein EDD39_7429 [Kitasatospora cineracea]
MSTPDFTVLDLDLPVGSKNKTATPVAGERAALLVVPGHRLPGAAADVTAVTDTREYLTAFAEELARAADAAALTDALVERYPDHGVLIARRHLASAADDLEALRATTAPTSSTARTSSSWPAAPPSTRPPAARPTCASPATSSCAAAASSASSSSSTPPRSATPYPGAL